MARSTGWLGWVGLMFFIHIVPEPLLAAKLELRQAGTRSTEVTVDVGDEFAVELWVDGEGRPLTGAAVFLSFDPTFFELAGSSRTSPSPFAPGPFLGNGEIYRNSLLAEEDPAAAASGVQVDYSVVRASGQGAGNLATFRLRALAPTQRSVVRIDESGARETRYFTPDGAHQPFQYIAPLQIQVRGIELVGLPHRLVLARGQTDTTSLQLDQFLFDPVYGPERIEWTVSPSAVLSLDFDTSRRLVRLRAPDSASPWEQLRVTATNPDGQSANALIEVFVNGGPQLVPGLGPLTLAEDQSFTWPLDNLASDPDAGPQQLQWIFAATPELGAALDLETRQLRFTPRADWNGEGQLTLRVVDEYGFADTAQVALSVLPVEDPPLFLISPNVRLIRGRQDSSLTRQALLSDAEQTPEQLSLSWEGADEVGIEERAGRLVLSAPQDWTGTEEIRLLASDPSGLSDQALLTVSVVPSLAPIVQEPPRRRGIAAGTHFVLALDALVIDPDDEVQTLRWQISGQAELGVSLSSTRALRVEAPPAFAGTETLHLEVLDPSGERAGFELLIFAAPADGSPAISPLPDLALPAGGIDTSIDLDDYLFDLDHEPARITWNAAPAEGVEVRIDPETHVLVISAAPEALDGVRQLELRALDPDGHQAIQTLNLRLFGGELPQPEPPDTASQTPLAPRLAELPALSIVAGQFDQSIDLDDFVSQGDPASLTWEVQAPAGLTGMVDGQTHRLLVLVEPGWEGEAFLLVRVRDALGQLSEALVRVQAQAAAPTLGLVPDLEIDLLDGDTEIRLPLSQLFPEGQVPAGLSWEVSAGQEVEVSPDAAGVLILKGAEPFASGQTLTLQARDPQNRLATGQLRLQVHPADGSGGQEVPEFRLALLPNPLQPEYLDLYVLSDLPLSQAPRLRLQDGQALEVIQLAPGIWQGSHVLRPGQAPALGFLALGLDQHRQLLISSAALGK
ncbi:MAG: hypothetical protein FJY95_12710 [Candidatus Handelsmanbacteria bacterium]|nr:hypothetical protein [Candidatus Handelsmanbacteria bacterium]